MQINQDSFKEGKLNFGMMNSPQRDEVYSYGHHIFNELILKDCPEYHLLLQGERQSIRRYIVRMTTYVNFKYMNKLASGLTYSSLKSLSPNEFNAIINRFKRYLNQHTEVVIELQNTFKR